MRFRCPFLEIPDPSRFPGSALPCPPAGSGAFDVAAARELARLVVSFEREGDPLQISVLGPLAAGRTYEVPVVATAGIPEPFDAWTAPWESRLTVFFNLGLWTRADLERHGLPLLVHETTHVVLADLLPPIDPTSASATLERLVIDEGVAHYLAACRSGLDLEAHGARWLSAEERLLEAGRRLADPTSDAEERRRLLLEANAGPYWQKYASVSGLFRAREIYAREGRAGLAAAIRAGRLPRQASP